MTLWPRLIEEIEDFNRNIRDLPVQEKVGPERVRDHLRSRYRFDASQELLDVVEDVAGLLRRWNVHVTHPRYFGLFNPSVRDAGVAGDLLVALYNPQLAAWSHAPAAQEIEQHTLNCFRRTLGMPDESVHHFTSGGFEANQSAVLTAIAHLFPESSEDGLAALRERPTIYVTSETHHSFVKIVRMCGLGTNSLREIPVDASLRMDVDALRERIDQDRAAGMRPLMIVGTAGTTSAGVVDPLPLLADVAEQTGAWYHVDGAWGASAVLIPRLKDDLAGVERADSVTWDAHKWLSAPMGAGMFFCRRAEAVRRAFAVTTTYMPAAARGAVDDPYATSAQWSRRAIGVKVFLALAELGLDGYGELLDHQAVIGDRLRERLQEAGWIVVNDTRLPVVCFTHPDLRDGRLRTPQLLRIVYKRAKVWISDVVLGDDVGKARERVLRACITSYRSDESDLDCLLEELESARIQALESS